MWADKTIDDGESSLATLAGYLVSGTWRKDRFEVLRKQFFLDYPLTF
jgi:hypothetical protein